jgi:hypothetical protein
MERITKKRDLPIPCVLEDSYDTWLALLTNEEAVELQDNYGELDFYFYPELVLLDAKEKALCD